MCLCAVAVSSHIRHLLRPLLPIPYLPQAEEVHARMSRQSAELGEAIAAAKEREAAAVQQLKTAEAKLREAVQRDEK